MITDIWLEAKNLNKDTINKRIKICEGCKNLDLNGGCNKCACYMPKKVTIDNVSCPINKW